MLQNIAFSASLRLPTTMSEEDKALRVRDALKVLRLDQVRHSIIGDEMQRGVSGGQRKRVNVAIEIVADPSVLFLDEPTSGLDSVSSTELARMLGDIARRKRLTIAAVIHSPSPAAFAAFTDLILLQTGGTPVYVGKLPGCEPYLASIGFTYPRGEKNGEPFADYMMGVVAGIYKPDHYNDLENWDRITAFGDLWKAHLEGERPDLQGVKEGKTKARRTSAIIRKTRKTAAEEQALQRKRSTCFLMKCLYRITDTIGLILTDLYEKPEAVMSQCKIRDEDPQRPQAGFVLQFRLCFVRAMRQSYGSFRSFVMGCVLTNLGIGLMLGVLMDMGDYLNVLGSYPEDICWRQYPLLIYACLGLQANSYVAALNFIAFIVIGAGAAVATNTFGAEKVIYWRESSTGLNSVAYFSAKVVADVPKALASTLCMLAGLLYSFVSPMNTGELITATVILYLNSYAAGYLLSFLLPYEACGMAAVGWGICWGLMFGGLSLTMREDLAGFKNNLMLISSARWYNEAVWYSSTMYPFSEVRDGPSKGKPYYNLDAANHALCFYKTLWEACGCAFACLLWWLAIDLFLIVFTKLDKKK